jgi:hypothetical protein
LQAAETGTVQALPAEEITIAPGRPVGENEEELETVHIGPGLQLVKVRVKTITNMHMPVNRTVLHI